MVAPGLSHNDLRQVHTHHTLSHNELMRFDDRWNLNWCQFCSQDPPDSMMKNGKLMSKVMDQRKMNQEGRLENSHSARHLIDPIRCCWTAIGMELCARYHLMGMGFFVEDFRAHYDPSIEAWVKPWYDYPVFFGNTRAQRGRPSKPDVRKKCSYSTTRKHFEKVYSSISPPITGYHVMHLQRGAAAREATSSGVAVQQTARQGGWKGANSLENNYLWSVPDEYVRYAAGYDRIAETTGNYPTIARACVDPPQDLIDQVFPYVKAVREAMAAEPEEWEHADDGTLSGFLEFLDDLAKYLLQDLAVLQERMDEHPIFGTELLVSQSFQNFRTQLLEQMRLRKKEFEAPTQGNFDPSVKRLMKAIYKRVLRMSKFERPRKDAASFGDYWQAPLDEEDDGTSCVTDLGFATMESVEAMNTSCSSSDSDAEDEDEEEQDDFRRKAPEGASHFGDRRGAEAMNSAMARTASTARQRNGVSLRDKKTWPPETPAWAKSKQFSIVESPSDLAREYYEGNPPPALKDLEEVHGTKAAKKGKSWRASPTRRKEWCVRKVAHDALDSAETPVEGVAKLQSIIEEELKESLQEGATAANPGSTVMKKLGVLRKKRSGAEARSEEGKKRAAKRRANKERRYDEETIQLP